MQSTRAIVHALAALAASTAWQAMLPLAQSATPEETLGYLNIRCHRNVNGELTHLELRPGARDYHLEAILECPERHTVTHITAPRMIASFERFKELEILPSLESLNLDGTKDANDYVACLQGFKSLKSLSLVGSGLTNHGLNDLCLNVPRLRKLDVSWTFVDENAFQSIAALRELEVLKLDNISSRTSVSPDEPPQDENCFRHLASLPSLRVLWISETRITSQHLETLALNCNLEEFDFNYRASGYPNLDYLRACNPYLLIGNGQERIAPQRFDGLRGVLIVDGQERIAPQRFDGLKGVERYRNIGPAEIMRLHWDHLKDLEFNDAPSLDFLPRAKQLFRLTLNRPKLTANDLNLLSDAKHLRFLYLHEARIGVPTAESLLKMHWLERLQLSKCTIDDSVLPLLEAAAARGQIQLHK